MGAVFFNTGIGRSGPVDSLAHPDGFGAEENYLHHIAGWTQRHEGFHVVFRVEAAVPQLTICEGRRTLERDGWVNDRSRKGWAAGNLTHCILVAYAQLAPIDFLCHPLITLQQR